MCTTIHRFGSPTNSSTSAFCAAVMLSPLSVPSILLRTEDTMLLASPPSAAGWAGAAAGSAVRNSERRECPMLPGVGCLDSTFGRKEAVCRRKLGAAGAWRPPGMCPCFIINAVIISVNFSRRRRRRDWIRGG